MINAVTGIINTQSGSLEQIYFPVKGNHVVYSLLNCSKNA
jgi:hypothetical protein